MEIIGPFIVIVFLITMASYFYLVWQTKGNILGEVDNSGNEAFKKECKFKVTIELGVYPHDDIHEIAKWLKVNAKKRYWGKKLPKEKGEWEKLSMYFENKEEAIRFKLEWQ